MEILQAVLLGLTALIITPAYLFYFDVTPKAAFVLIGTSLAMIWAMHAKGGSSRKLRLFGMLAALQAASLCVSAALAGHGALPWIGTTWRRYGVLTQAAALLFAWLLAWRVNGQPHRVRSTLRVLAVTSAALSLYGIAQYFGWDPLLPAAAYHVGEGVWTIVRPPGTLGYSSYFATWLVMSVFLCVSLLGLEKQAAWRAIAYAGASLAAAAMVLTGTRAAMLGLAAGGVVWLYRQGRRVPGRRLLAAAGVCMALAGLYFSPAGQAMRSRMRWFAEDPWGGARPKLWRDSIGMFLQRPVTGYGPETFTAAFPPFESLELARQYPDFVYESAHNILLDAAVSQGLPGVMILGGILLLGLGTKNAGLAGAMTAGIVAQQFTVFTLPTALLTFVTVALAISLTEAHEETGSLPGIYKWAAPVPAAFVMYLAVRMLAGDHALALTQQSLAAGDEAAASAHFAEYERRRLPGAGGELWYSRACLNLAQKTQNPVVRFQALMQAGGAGVRATQGAEDPMNAWYSLAVLYATQGDTADTEKCLRASSAANSNWFKPHWTLAQLLRLEGRAQEAEQEAEQAVRCDGGKDAEVSRTLAELRAARIR